MANRQILPVRAHSQRQRDPSRPLISVVVPVYNEEACLPELHRRLTEVLRPLGDDYEILLVDDGSSDRSLHIIRELACRDPHVGYRAFSRNFGHEAATTCGLEHARGQTVVLIDADLQDPPELIPEMLSLWREGFDLIYAQRSSRAGEGAITRLTSHLFYRLLKRLAPVDIPVDTGDFRLMDRAVVEAFGRLPERNRFVRGMIAWTGFRKTSVQYERNSRLAGQTKYDFFKRLRLALDAVCGMSTAPLQWITYLGLIVTVLSAGGGLLGGCLRFLFGVPVDGSLLLAAAMFFLAGVQLLATGTLGQYIGRTYTEVQAKPLYLLAESQSPAAGAAAPGDSSQVA